MDVFELHEWLIVHMSGMWFGVSSDLVEQCPKLNFCWEGSLRCGQLELGCVLIGGVRNNGCIQYSVFAPVLHNRRDLMNVTGTDDDHARRVMCRVSDCLQCCDHGVEVASVHIKNFVDD